MNQSRVELGPDEMTPEQRAHLEKTKETMRRLIANRGKKTDWAWRCQECGHKFRSLAAVQRASWNDGCPKCGGVDVDYSLPVVA